MILSVKDRQEEFYTITPIVVKNYNKSCKQILEYPPILSRICKECVKELKNESVDEIENKIINFNQIKTNQYHLENKVNEEFEDYDVVVRYDGEPSFYVNIQATRNKKRNVLIKETAYLSSNLIVNQKWNEFFYEEYENLKKVIQISIILNSKGENKIIKSQWIHQSSESKMESIENVIDFIQIYLSQQNLHNDCLKMLEYIFLSHEKWEKRKTILKEEFDITFSEEMEREVLKMSSWGEEIAEMNFERGLLAGEESATIRCIENLINNIDISTEEAMKLLNVAEERKEYFMTRIRKMKK